MKVSIIVPLYNLASFVSETLNSAIQQSHQDVEIIVVNDASTDNSLDVVREYTNRDSRIKIIDLKQNVGLPAARNLAIATSTGEFILPLDADDWIDSQYIEVTLRLMTPDVGVVSTYMDIFGFWPEKTGKPGSGYPIISPTREQILNGNCMPVCSLIRKKALAEVGGYPESMKEGSEDWALWALIVCKTKWRIEVLPEYLFHYRTRPGSMSRQATMMPFEQAREKIRRLCA